FARSLKRAFFARWGLSEQVIALFLRAPCDASGLFGALLPGYRYQLPNPLRPPCWQPFDPISNSPVLALGHHPVIVAGLGMDDFCAGISPCAIIGRRIYLLNAFEPSRCACFDTSTSMPSISVIVPRVAGAPKGMGPRSLSRNTGLDDGFDRT